MRVRLVSTRPDWYGGEEQLRLLLRGLLARGHEASALVPRGAVSARRLAEQRLPVRTFPGGGHGPRALATIRCALRGIDVVHCNDPRALTATTLATAGRRRHRCVASRRVDFVPRSPWVYRRYAARVVCVSDAIRAICWHAGIPDEKLRLVYDGVDPARTAGGDPARGRAVAGARAGIPLVLSVAKCKPSKGIADLIEAAARVPADRAVFVHAGDGPLLAEHRRQAEALGLGERFRLLGYCDEVADLFAAADLFVMPSRFEGLGSSVIDAMLARVPVIATDAGGLPELTRPADDGKPLAWQTRAGDPAALANAILAALADPAERARRAARGHERARRRFTDDAMVEATLAVYRELP